MHAEPDAKHHEFIRSIFEGHPPVVVQEIASDSLHFVKVAPVKAVLAKHKPGLRRLFSRASPPPDPAPQGEGVVPRKCKGCTFVYGNQTVAGKKAQVAAGDKATASVVEKKAGPTVVASDSSTQNAVLGGDNLAAAIGAGSQATQVVPLPEPKLTVWQKFKADAGAVWSAVKWPLVVVAGIFGIGAAVCALAPTSTAGVWLLAFFKRRKSSNETAV